MISAITIKDRTSSAEGLLRITRPPKPMPKFICIPKGKIKLSTRWCLSNISKTIAAIRFICTVNRKLFLWPYVSFTISIFSLHFNNVSYMRPNFVVCCAIWYHLHNLKNMKNTHWGVFLLVNLQVFLRFLYYANGTKLGYVS